MLIDKKKAEPVWRPLCILNNDGKLMEALLRPRIRDAIRNGGDLPDRQYGSKNGRSTIDAVREVTAAVEAANRVWNAARPIVLLVTLDVKNAFNTSTGALLFTKNVTVRHDNRTKIPTLVRGHCAGLSGGAY